MDLKIKRYDAADYLDNEETIRLYIKEALNSRDPLLIADALGAVARAKGMSKVAKSSGLSRESLYKALSADGNPGFLTICKVAEALGFFVDLVPMPSTRRRAKKVGAHRCPVAKTTKTKTRRKVA